ncbi:hypothetical protein EO95_06210 [Methanosarcina sp. 1.H.T.1A.1]|nr:hypothetical protein EO95_06210 [Methanosarcina sp. 1.H.T.1A.1]
MVIDKLSKPKYVKFPVGINKRFLDDVCYELDRDTDALTITSEGNFYDFPKERAPNMVNSLGLEKIKTVKKVSILLAASSLLLLLFLLFLRQTLEEAYWPLSIILFLACMMFFFVATDLYKIENYYNISRCKKCGRDFAYEEIKKSLIKKVSTYDDYEETDTRYFKCKYCSDEDLKIKSLLKKSKSKARNIYRNEKNCKECGKNFALIEYREADTHLESFDTRRTIKHYKCTHCEYMEISIKDDYVTTN